MQKEKEREKFREIQIWQNFLSFFSLQKLQFFIKRDPKLTFFIQISVFPQKIIKFMKKWRIFTGKYKKNGIFTKNNSKKCIFRQNFIFFTKKRNFSSKFQSFQEILAKKPIFHPKSSIFTKKLPKIRIFSQNFRVFRKFLQKMPVFH